MQEFKSQKIKAVLKVQLKKKGLTYQELAEQFDCSVPTIKRILGPEELSLNRLLQFCEILQLDLSDLENMIKDQIPAGEKFTESQELFLAKNKPYFAYLMKLFEGKSPKQIADEHQLNARSTDKYLIGLEKNELIRVTGKQKVKPAFKQLPMLKQGPLAKVYFESFIRTGTQFFVDVIQDSFQDAHRSPDEKNKSKFSIRSVKMSLASFERWTQEAHRMHEELERLATYEEKVMDPSQLRTAVVIDAHSLVKSEYSGLKMIQNALGDIPNM